MKGLDAWLTTPPEQPENCEVCGAVDVDSCVCPECPHCGLTGDPDCYKEVDLGVCGELFGKETTAQRVGKAQAEIRELESRISDIGQYIWLLKRANESGEPGQGDL